jgi:large-conductance mechanosensitive channel
MDDTPRAFIEEFRASILKKRVGQIAIAVVLAQAVWRLLNAFTWYLIMPIIGRFVQGQTESVLLPLSTARPILWENLFGAVLEFLLTIIVAFYANRWIHAKSHSTEDNAEPEYSLIGEPLDRRDERAASETSI